MCVKLGRLVFFTVFTGKGWALFCLRSWIWLEVSSKEIVKPNVGPFFNKSRCIFSESDKGSDESAGGTLDTGGMSKLPEESTNFSTAALLAWLSPQRASEMKDYLCLLLCGFSPFSDKVLCLQRIRRLSLAPTLFPRFIPLRWAVAPHRINN